MALLGDLSAEMSLRYGRLFDQTVRESSSAPSTQAKASLGPVLPEATPRCIIETDWRRAPLIKARLAGGYCLRSLAQGPCAYANICEHCPNLRSEKTFLPILRLRRVDAEALLADAEARGWGAEVARHRRLIERIDASDRQRRCRLSTTTSRPWRPSACEELATSGQPISFKEVAVRAGTSRTTLYRRADLRALVEEHRTRGPGGEHAHRSHRADRPAAPQPGSRSRPRSADKKNGFASSNAEIAGTAETLPPE